jgi:hypothetical protein
MRGQYNELTSYPEEVTDIIKDLEGRAFTSGIEFNRKQGFEAINYAVYGVARVEGQLLALLQLRRAERQKPGYFTSVRKDYYLIGRNENGNAFAHPIENTAVRGTALSTVEGPVLKALAGIWGVRVEEVNLIRRNGDVAFVPATARSIPKDVVEISGVALTRDFSHLLMPGRGGKLFYSSSGFFVKGAARIAHRKGQHPTAVVTSGIWRVVEGARATHWGFTHPTTD